MTYVQALFGSAPGDIMQRIGIAFLRALRTFIQGVAAALVSAFPGQSFFDVTYWEAFGFAVLAAGITAVASFLQNVANVLPTDPTQQVPEQPAPEGVPAPGGTG